MSGNVAQKQLGCVKCATTFFYYLYHYGQKFHLECLGGEAPLAVLAADHPLAAGVDAVRLQAVPGDARAALVVAVDGLEAAARLVVVDGAPGKVALAVLQGQGRIWV